MALVRQMELLRSRIKMMKMESLGASLVSANRATASGLFDELPLDHPPTPRYSLGPTLRATVVATSLEHELGAPMAPAEHLGPGRISGDSGSLAPERLESILSHPVADGGDAALKPLSDIPKAQTLADKRFKLSFIDTSPWCMLLRVTRR
ncbi:MAG TPA: hypothetical protein VIS51_03115 [Solirubrobacterales bacterium]